MAPRIAVGTCGFSYRDWIGPVYPPGTPSRKMLEQYARRLTTVEIDATYYAVPGAATFESMARRTPDSFRFTAKLPSSATHVPDAAVRGVHADVRAFRSSIDPLIDAGKFACVLMQFPNAFRPSAETHAYLGMLRDALDDVELVAEFRHRDWQTHETLELLHALQIGIVNVDQPHFKTLMRESADVTSEIAYIRFHGRNAATWWRGTNETRYDYQYTPDELLPWVNRIIDIAANPDVREVFSFFNNHRRGQAVRNAEMLIEMLAERIDDVARAAPHGELDPQQLSLLRGG
jgi:uncharacterized protein YecE (DUF72 family)